MRHMLVIAAVTAGLTLMIPAVLVASSTTSITPSSIAGAKLGLGKAAYKKLLGGPVRFQSAAGGDIKDPGFQQPADYTRLVFTKRKMDVYFQGGVDRAIEITTWNKAYRTAEGVGPCSTLAQVKAAYGSRLKPTDGNPPGPDVYSYKVGRSLIFGFWDRPPHLGTPSPVVTAVALYDGSKPGWNKPNGAESFAGFVSAWPDQVPCA